MLSKKRVSDSVLSQTLDEKAKAAHGRSWRSIDMFSLIWSIWIEVAMISMGVRSDQADHQGLISFMNAVDDGHVLVQSWQGDDPCTLKWVGVQCNKGRVWNLMLESQKLKGTIPDDSLSKLDKLRKLSLKDNALAGNLPSLSSPFLRTIWLQNNEFEGPIFDIFYTTQRLNVLSLSNNKLTGPIPNSLASVANLRQLNLQNNSLSGSIPAFDQPTLKVFNVSDNQLSGEIPETNTLQHTFNRSSFLHNPGLCGIPLNITCKKDESTKRGPLVARQIVGIVVGDFAVLMLITLAFNWHYRRKSKAMVTKDRGKKKKKKEGQRANKSEHKKSKAVESKGEQAQARDEEPMKDSSTSESPEGYDIETSKMVLVSGELTTTDAFELEDLLRASAELLGKGGLGTSYKAILEERGLTVVVKRLGKGFNACEKKEFEQQTQLLGCLHHPNLVPLLAYYFAKDEKLLVYSYMPNSSLFTFLHGKCRRGRRASLDWRSRLKVACEVAQGLMYLHRECKSQKVPHGNIKSSNILFGKAMEARLADYGLAPLLHNNLSLNSHHIVACTAPEFISSRKLTHKTDVFCYGVLLLELLTGKLPSHYSKGEDQDSAVDLPGYVRSAKTQAEWTATDVLDVAMASALANPADLEGMISLLNLAMDCVAVSPDQRPKMSHVYEQIQEIKDASDSFSSDDLPPPTMSPESTRELKSTPESMTALRGCTPDSISQVHHLP